MDEVYDYVVVGAGAAGCVVGGRLSEDPGVRVAVLEAGGPNNNVFLKIPSMAMLASTLPEHNWYFETEAVPALGGRTLRWSQGKVVGGSGSINGMICMRGHSSEFDRWERSGCEGWGFDGVLPFFKKAEANARGGSALHGDAGPLKLRQSSLRLRISEAFLAAGRESGVASVDDLNSNVVEGFGFFDVNIHRGRRQSTASAYLHAARRRRNLTVHARTPVRRILIENGRACGVEVGAGAARRTIRAEREVVLCGGAVSSPQLLMLSGIGPADHLRELGIPVVADRAAVGANLQNHPAYRLRYTCSQPVTVYSYMSPLRVAGGLLQYALGGRGPFGESFGALGGFFRTDPSLEVSDLIVVMAPALLRSISRGSDRSLLDKLRDMKPHQDGFMIGAILGRPASRGRIRLRSSDPAQSPRIFPNYYAEAADMLAMVRGVQRLREMMRAPAIRSLIGSELQPGDECRDDRALENDIRAKSETSFHPNGTCRMGGDPDSVVDPQLRVRGVAGLRVADASIIPLALNACTHGPAIMIGEKAAHMIREGSA